MTSPSALRPTRRRARSSRVITAVVLLVVAALLVLGALFSHNVLLLSAAAVLAVLFGVIATRLTHNELMSARVDAAADRAELAQSYRDLSSARIDEQQAHELHLLASHQAAVADLEAALTAAHQRAADALAARAAESRRADASDKEGRELAVRLEEADARAAEAILRVHELEQELDVARAELEAQKNQLAQLGQQGARSVA